MVPRPAVTTPSRPRALLGLALACLLGNASALAGASTPSLTRITGTVVVAETGVPLPGALVEVEGTTLRTTTNAQGRFDLTGLPVELTEVGLHFTRLGFAPVLQVVRTGEEDLVRLEVRMEREAVALDPIAVLLARTRMIGDPTDPGGTPGSAFYLGSRDLQTRKLAHDNVHEVLRQVPGIHVQDEEGYGLRPHIGLRGAGAERSSNVTLMEDGVLIAPAPYAAPAAYYFPSTGRLDGIEIRKGASQIRYGPRTLGGAINLLSAPIPDRQAWMVDLSGGQDAMMKGHARIGGASARTGWLVEGYTLRTDGFKELQGGGGTGFETRDFLAKVRVNSDRAAPRYQELEIKVGATDHASEETYLGLTDVDFRQNALLRYAASADDLLRTDHRQIQARYFLQPGARTDVVATVYRNEFDRNWYKLQSVGGKSLNAVLEDPEENAALLAILQGADSEAGALRIRANNRGYVSQGLQAALGLRMGEADGLRHDLELGVRLHEDHENRLQWEDGYAMSGGRPVRTSAAAPGSQENRLGEARAVALYLQDEVRAGAWTLIPGARFESIAFTRSDWPLGDEEREASPTVRRTSVSAFIPGMSVSYEWSPWTTLFAGVHRGFGPPGPGADQETKVEESLNTEVGVRVRRRGVGANLTTFYSAYTNILGQETLATGGSGTGDLFNGGAVRVAGVEAAADSDLAAFLRAPMAIPLRAAYTFNRGTFQSSFVSAYGPWGSVERGDRLPYMPEHLWSGSIGLEDPRWTVTLAWNGASEMRTEAGQDLLGPGTGVDRFHIFNLAGEASLGGSTTVYAAVQNLTDQRYVVSRRPAGARPGLPRTFFVGLRVSR